MPAVSAIVAQPCRRSCSLINEKPKGHYLLVTYEATYNGPERTADARADLSWSLTTNDNRILTPASVVSPAENQEWPTSVRSGARSRYKRCSR
jgi:hypothetical protein